MTSSIRLRLLKWLIGPLVLIHLVGGGVVYAIAWKPIETALDQGLADAAWALIPNLRELQGDVRLDLSKESEQILRLDRFDAVYFVVRNTEGKTLAGDSDFPPLPSLSATHEPYAYDAVMRGGTVRVIALKTYIGQEAVQIGVAETLAKRRYLRSALVASLLLFEGLITVSVVVLAWSAVGRGLRPLRRMQADLGKRGEDDLSPVDSSDVPVELRPLVGALNGLLHRLLLGMQGRQDFLANVAHQLRTPLAGIKMQLEWLQGRYARDPETARSAALMMSSTERMIRQTNQFLALARAEPSQFERNRLEEVQLDKLVEESVQHFVEVADRKRIDLGFDLQPTRLQGDHFLLRDLIDNLIDNAIRYSQPGGPVTVRCAQAADGAVFSVEDSGPGITEREKELIFNRYYRADDKVPGTGLGLAIVSDIAKDHGAEIALTPGPGGKGTTFSVHFPRQALDKRA